MVGPRERRTKAAAFAHGARTARPAGGGTRTQPARPRCSEGAVMAAAENPLSHRPRSDWLLGRRGGDTAGKHQSEGRVGLRGSEGGGAVGRFGDGKILLFLAAGCLALVKSDTSAGVLQMKYSPYVILLNIIFVWRYLTLASEVKCQCPLEE